MRYDFWQSEMLNSERSCFALRLRGSTGIRILLRGCIGYVWPESATYGTEATSGPKGGWEQIETTLGLRRLIGEAFTAKSM
ncbi:uncharacterized protein MYCGRDRAFT_103262 [Zymoseptoria tritici IPO323]|uniref:Uncharacterized protein n=1 Tax=Zymoseptoria tritici (strain CBS 115943 / IPO323) TaxID=336722 RepID=F9X3P3_ZYMTI|nr:uncharacterized protein MYCGRDRAFT_103262 [Zymoseptoria tritici IPO323]EGP89933.1 hypothetical protein MYCGRDRAFT_103262 [Zymoseptoria tritici IPO323]